jgi:N-sulfoglucosamine sulfohydrolase
MSGRSFIRLLRGESYEHRKHIFGARLVHGNARFTPQTKASTFDLSRCVRSKRFKLIYNCTPQMEYQPVDSARDAGWVETMAAHKAGRLPAELSKAYFTQPRPVLELFDLSKDPSELNNLAGNPDHATVQQELLEVMAEKMILDFDFLPLPLE